MDAVAQDAAPGSDGGPRGGDTAPGRRDLWLNGSASGLLAALVVVSSVATFMTSSMTRQIEDGIAHGNELAVRLRAQVGAPAPGNRHDEGCGPADTVPDPPIRNTDDGLIVGELQDFAATVRAVHKAATKLNVMVDYAEANPLDIWAAMGTNNAGPENPVAFPDAGARLELNPALVNFRKDALCKIATYEQVRDFAQNVRNDSLMFYGAIAAYCLPVLYALLGAFAFNLRDFAADGPQRSRRASSAATTARTITAATAGAVISLFNTFGQGVALPPLALAFLVGYGVEAFFASLDALLASFGGRRQARAVADTP